jgi:hypothetical protein
LIFSTSGLPSGIRDDRQRDPKAVAGLPNPVPAGPEERIAFAKHPFVLRIIGRARRLVFHAAPPRRPGGVVRVDGVVETIPDLLVPWATRKTQTRVMSRRSGNPISAPSRKGKRDVDRPHRRRTRGVDETRPAFVSGVGNAAHTRASGSGHMARLERLEAQGWVRMGEVPAWAGLRVMRQRQSERRLARGLVLKTLAVRVEELLQKAPRQFARSGPE